MAKRERVGIHARDVAVAAMLATLLTSSASAGLLVSESFETDGESTRYVSTGEFRDTTGTYFMRTNNQQNSGQPLADNATPNSPDRRYSINGATIAYTNMDGSFVWAAENVDAGPANPAVLTLNTVNIAGYSDVVFRGLFGGTFADTADYMRVSYSINGGGFTQALLFATTAIGNTVAIALDTDNNGRGDAGPENVNLLGSALKPFYFDIPSANTLAIRVEVFADASADEFGFDLFQIYVPEPAGATVLVAGATLAILRRRSRR